MPNVRTSVEGARGCGYRKGGGLYLVSGRLSEPCPLLPIALDVCPTCHAGIKPTRSWTWVDGVALAVRDHPDPESWHALTCPLNTHARIKLADGTFGEHPLKRAGLIWIGERYYKTAQDFTAEATRMGVSRRIPAVPRDFELGVTWVLLAHRKAVPNPLYAHTFQTGEGSALCFYPTETARSGMSAEPRPDDLTVSVKVCGLPEDNPAHVERTAGIFTTFRPTAVEYVVKGDETEEELAALEKRGLSLVKVIRAEETAATVEAARTVLEDVAGNVGLDDDL